MRAVSRFLVVTCTAIALLEIGCDATPKSAPAQTAKPGPVLAAKTPAGPVKKGPRGAMFGPKPIPGSTNLPTSHTDK